MSSIPPAGERIPVTILTGFLGSGKTTLLNRILREQHGRRIAVIENEYGEAGIDNEILLQERDEQIVVMNNGCICCSVRGDLARLLGELEGRRREGALDFERVVIETTGLADPAPVAQTFFMHMDVARAYVLDAIITLVDARHAPAQLDRGSEAQEQIAFADRLLISKTDLVDAAQVEALSQRLVGLNPRAPQLRVHFGAVPVEEVLDIGGFAIDSALEIDPGFLEGRAVRHDQAVGSFVFRDSRPFDPQRLDLFMRLLSQQYGADLLRYKGVLNVYGRDSRVVFQGVHMVMGAQEGKPWGEGEPRTSTMVFIGRRLPQRVFEEGLRHCLVEGGGGRADTPPP
ncbi:MAG: GTP-binding protein [Burkholderiales bacterium]|nr:GTP-binding protein [Burkholderiales bacterium]